MSRMISALGFLLVTSVFSTAHGQNVPLITIPDYPRYGTEPTTTQREEMRKVARGVVGALLTGAEVNVAVVGHADFDAKGRAFEGEVSSKRALGAESALRTLTQEELAKAALPISRLDSVHFSSIGLGTARPVFPSPRSEDERRANRRVDFVVTVGAVIPVVLESPFQRCVRVLTGGGPPGPVRRMTCACNKFLQQSPRVQDTHYDFQARKRLPGLADLSPQDLAAAVSGMVLHMRPDISGSSAGSGTSDPDFANSLRSLDDTVGRNINDFRSQLNAGATASVFDQLIVADILNRMGDPNHVYSCYDGYSRRNHDQ